MTETLQKLLIVEFVPERDITTYELAVIANFPSQGKPLAVGMFIHPCQWQELDPIIKRHFQLGVQPAAMPIAPAPNIWISGQTPTETTQSQ